MNMTLDHPNLRASLDFPLCRGFKDEALVVCWPCYRSGFGYGLPEMVQIVDLEEARLEQLAKDRLTIADVDF